MIAHENVLSCFCAFKWLSFIFFNKNDKIREAKSSNSLKHFLMAHTVGVLWFGRGKTNVKTRVLPFRNSRDFISKEYKNILKDDFFLFFSILVPVALRDIQTSDESLERRFLQNAYH